jgi:hypothetical protein
MSPATLAKQRIAVKPAGVKKTAPRRRKPARESATPVEDAIEARRIAEGRRGYYDHENLAIVKERMASGDDLIPVDDEFIRRLCAGD